MPVARTIGVRPLPSRYARGPQYVGRMLAEDEVDEFRETGLVVLRRFFDASALSAELDRAMTEGVRSGTSVNVGSAGIAFEYVPMMCDHTPVSLTLLDALAEPAGQLLGRAVLPTRAKGTRYFGATAWHTD